MCSSTDYLDQAKELVAQMTREEKVSLLSGQDTWNTKPIERLGVPSVMFSDGPHGLRKQVNEGDNLGIGDSLPAVCFPTASALACSFDRDLIGEVGKTMGEECQKEQVAVILGPGINMKRNPLCGRNFEYYSEDPVVSGELGAAMINGIQSTGTGTSLKHFAVNNQEKRRMSINAIVDERTLRETYLKAFEIALKKSAPRTVMCSYNRLNGCYNSENKRLLTDILRDEYGYKGIVVSDWGAVHDRALGVACGQDIEMPGNGGYNDKKVLAALEQGTLSEEELDKVAIRMTAFALECAANLKPDATYDEEAHHAVAVKAEENSAVLLKNEDQLLPGTRDQKVAVIGAFAREPRYQGAGSSKINPIRVDSPLEELKKAGVTVDYAPGYRVGSIAGDADMVAKVQNRLIEQACKVAKGADICYIFAGLPDSYESEGFDRSTMAMPEDQTRLIKEVAKVNPNVAVILLGGAPIELPWADSAKAILLAYLGGEGMGTAVTHLLLGDAVPSGKLAETWPFRLDDCSSTPYFPGNERTVEYRESIFVGYKYYETAGVPVRYPFGYGLSYTSFEYSDFSLQKAQCDYGDVLTASVKIKNIGKVAGKETVFLFSSHENETVFTPKKELRNFAKVALEPGEEKVVTLELNTKDLGYYNVLLSDWYAEPGTYQLSVGASSADIRLETALTLNNEVQPQPDYRESAPCYYHFTRTSIQNITTREFEAILGESVPFVPDRYNRPYAPENTIEDIRHTALGAALMALVKVLASSMAEAEEGQAGMMEATLKEMPLFAMTASEPDMLPEFLMLGIVDLLNGKYSTAAKRVIKGFLG